jgi:hypothetical protein
MRNTFDVEQVFKNMDKEFNRKAQPRKIIGDYEIEPTGIDGSMSYRYEFKQGNFTYFGYAETIDEARENILTAQAKGGE